MRLISKDDYLNLARTIVEPALQYYDETHSTVVFPVSSFMGKLTPDEETFESFARPLWAAAYLVKDGDKDLGKRILRMIANGTNPQSSSYWGGFVDYDHKLVDLPAICLFLYENIDLVRKYYSEEEKNAVAHWILCANEVKAWENNWLFFAILNNAFLLNAGLGGSREIIEENWKTLNSHYRGSGWYGDGKNDPRGYYGRRDYYIAFGYHFYSLLWLSVDRDMTSDVRDTITKRAEAFAKSFILFFDDNGEAVPFGRSLIYRFAQAAFWGAYERAGLSGISPSVVKGIINRNMRWWLSQDIFDENGLLTLGYAYANKNISEVYSGCGSPYWACKLFVLLGLSNDAEFWRAEEQDYPKPKQESLCIGDADLLVSKHQGIVNLFPINQSVRVDWTNKIAKYEKFVYSTRTGFCLSNEKGLTIPEIGVGGTVAVSENGDDWTVRSGAKSKFLTKDTIRSFWSVGPQVSINTYIAVRSGWHVRIHIINSEKELWVADGGHAAPSVTVNAQTTGKRIAIHGDDFYSAARSLIHGSPNLCQMEKGLNSNDPNSSVPYVLSWVKPGKSIIVNGFYLGAEAPKTNPFIALTIKGITLGFFDWIHSASACLLAKGENWAKHPNRLRRLGSKIKSHIQQALKLKR